MFMRMRLMKNLLFSVVFLISIVLHAEKTEYSAPEFLEKVRHPPGRECWASMDGKAIHQRRGKPLLEALLYLGIRFTPERTIAQVVVNKIEAYYVGQAYSASGEAASVIPANKTGYDKSVLADFGIRPQDLTMTFLFWDLVKELEKDSVKGRDCRVFLLSSKDKSELAKVSISSEYFFPLRVEWYSSAENELGKPYRTLEVSSFRREDDFWVISGLLIYGPGWQTKIEFDETHAGFKDEAPPANLFREIKTSEKKSAGQ